MIERPDPSFSVNVDVTNPGQYFACCGLLELADRVWPGTVAWFEDAGVFSLAMCDPSASALRLLGCLTKCSLTNTMTALELDELKQLKSRRVKDLSELEKVRKKTLESLWRESPVVVGDPFKIKLDWFQDSRSGGSRFKTWAGQQSVIDIATAMLQPIQEGGYEDVLSSNWLTHPHGHKLTFNFDSDASAQGAALDVGFSLDPLGMSSHARPLMEFLSFVAMQRFRPSTIAGENRYVYATWERPLATNAAAMVTAGITAPIVNCLYGFPLLYRTKYLKSFLPASPIGQS